MFCVVVIAFHLIQLHGPDGQEIDINPHEVASLREPSAVSESHFPKSTRCVVIMTNNRFNAVREDCDTVRTLVEEAQ